ncbi:DUF1016 N-terminal domain-containing protein [Leptolyngbya sp. Heron Island J]|uniref:DUF1016 N-terminal domain-containing protein n=1 Tax=Leptolyngbya sp. Heron Island J TaxID=1385935 RepID=UPI002E124426
MRCAQVRAALAVNGEVILLYWDLGLNILERQATEGWGSKVIDRLSKDLKRDFPEMKVFRRATLNICVSLPRRPLIEKLCSDTLHNFHGDIIRYYWTR